MGQLLQIPLQKCHLLLLCPVVRRSQNVVVLFACVIQRNLKLHHPLTAVLQIAHQRLLHGVKLSYLLLQVLAGSTIGGNAGLRVCEGLPQLVQFFILATDLTP